MFKKFAIVAFFLSFVVFAVVDHHTKHSPEELKKNHDEWAKGEAGRVLDGMIFIKDAKGRCFVYYETGFGHTATKSLAPIDCSTIAEDEFVKPE